MKVTIMLIAALAAMVSPAIAQTYQPPQVRLLEDPYGRDAPRPGGIAPDLRPDPIPAYREFPSRWQKMQQPNCQPVLDPQTGRTTAWRCRMADGTEQLIR